MKHKYTDYKGRLEISILYITAAEVVRIWINRIGRDEKSVKYGRLGLRVLIWLRKFDPNDPHTRSPKNMMFIILPTAKTASQCFGPVGLCQAK